MLKSVTHDYDALSIKQPYFVLKCIEITPQNLPPQGSYLQFPAMHGCPENVKHESTAEQHLTFI